MNPATAALVVLVHGTTNSLLGQYFTDAILEDFRSQGHEVVVSKNLVPFGDYQLNGKILGNLLDDVCGERTTWMVGHSAGGMYALAAIGKTRCKIAGVATIGTPLLGSRLAPQIGGTFLGQFFMSLLPWMWFETGIFADYFPEQTHKFFGSLEPFPHKFRLVSFAGAQPRPDSWKDSWDARFLMPWLSAMSRGYGSSNDGLVETESAWGTGLVVRTKSGDVKPEPQLPAYPLDHMEQFGNVRLINFLHTHCEETVQAQRDLYRSVAKAIAN